MNCDLTPDQCACLCCDGHNSRIFCAREMMFGFRDEFRYRECLDCGCLRLMDVPVDLARYYPAHYQSFGARPYNPGLPKSSVRRWLVLLRNSGQLLRKPVVGALLAWLRPRPDFRDLASMLRYVRGVSFNSPVLDVGCGSGALLFRLADAGFTNLWGVDPFLEQDTAGDERVRIRAAATSSLNGMSFDLIMLHHSLEHMLDQRHALQEIKRLMSRRGTCIIRIPVARSDPWNRYGSLWAELDAPRHIYLHTLESFRALARSESLDVMHVEFDSEPLAYWLSELYRRDISWVDANTKAYRNPRDIFTDSELSEFERLASQANANGTGGRAAFYLKHSN